LRQGELDVYVAKLVKMVGFSELKGILKARTPRKPSRANNYVHIKVCNIKFLHHLEKAGQHIQPLLY
jgi:hypothetical protein